MAIYSITLDSGWRQTLVEARSPAQAKRYAIDEFGRHLAPYSIERATDKDVAWVKGMGGRIHEAG